MDEVPESLDATVAALNAWYEAVIPPGQQAAVQLYENVRATSQLQDEDGHVLRESFVAWAFRLFNLTLAGNYMISYADDQGMHTGYEAIQRGHDAHARRVYTLFQGLNRWDPNCPRLGDVGGLREGGQQLQMVHDHPATDAEHINKFHRLLASGVVARRHLMTFYACLHPVDDTMFNMGLQEMSSYHWLTMQSTNFKNYKKLFTNRQLVEQYIGDCLLNENLKVKGNDVYAPELEVQTRPIVSLNKSIGQMEYICAQCGKFKSEHRYNIKEEHDNGDILFKLLLPNGRNGRTNHAFERLTRPIEGSPEVPTGTYGWVATVEQFIRARTSQRNNMGMWMLRTNSDLNKIIEDIKQSTSGDIPLLRLGTSRVFRDVTLHTRTGRVVPKRCICYNYFSNDAIGYTVETPESIGTVSEYTGKFEIDPDILPMEIPDDDAPMSCPNCGASTKPFKETPALYTDIYMDYPECNATKAGLLCAAYKSVESIWFECMVTSYLSDMDWDSDWDVILQQAEDVSTNSIDFDNPKWKTDLIQTLKHNTGFTSTISNTMNVDFFDTVNDQFLQQGGEPAKQYCCIECKKYLNHPDHDPDCSYAPSCVNFHSCAHCDEATNHENHTPVCRPRVLAKLYENMDVHPEEICFMCKRKYHACACPVGNGYGFLPHYFLPGAEDAIETAYDSIFMNNLNNIPKNAYHFIEAMMGRTLGERVGDGSDSLAGCVLIHGPKRTGKSELLIAFVSWFPEHQRGDIPDNAEEQWWSSHLVNAVTGETVKVVTCMELSPKCRVKMTEWQSKCLLIFFFYTPLQSLFQTLTF